MRLWKAYYTEGEFSDRDGSPWEAPRTGVQIMATQWPNSRSNVRFLGPVDRANDGFIAGKSYYCLYEDDQGYYWLNHDLIAMVEYLAKVHKPCVLRGEYISEAVHGDALRRATTDDHIVMGTHCEPHPAWAFTARRSLKE